jgi:hypothetical protein
VSVLGELSNFDNHLYLRNAIRAHLQDKTPAEVWIRNAFPDGYCPLRKTANPPNEKSLAKTKIGGTPATILAFPKRNED